MNQVIESTTQEMTALYDLLTKEKLIEMLIECNRHLDKLLPVISSPYPTEAVQPGWISVEDRLPEDEQKILFCFADGTGPSAWYKYPTTMNKGDFKRRSPTEASFRIDMWDVNNANVTHWMPLPSPPNK